MIDGNAIIHRAYHAYPPLTTSKGELINAVYGFTSILLTVLRQLKAEYVAVTFDKKAPTFRHKEFKAYKAHRPKMDEELVGQIGRVHEVVETLNIPIFEQDGFEGDDVIGTLTKLAKVPKVKSNNLEIIVVTGDYDTVQLINDKVRVMMPPRGKKPAAMLDYQAVIQKYGFEPKYMIDFKALAGDASDGIPGVSGIGPKTATELIKEFGTVENIYNQLGIKLNEIKATQRTQNKQRALKSSELIGKFRDSIVQKLIVGAESAKLSKRLATIVTNVPLKFNLDKCKLTDYDRGKAIKLFETLEFRTLINKLPQESWEEVMDEKKATLKALKKTEETEDKQMELF